MPTLQEDLDLPGQVDPTDVTVRVQLWGSGQATAGVETSTGKLIAGTRSASGASWSISNLIGNTAISSPAGTVYKVERRWPNDEPIVTYISMPATGGPYTPKQIETDPPSDLPTVQPANLVDEAVLTTPTSNLSVNAFALALVPNTTVTVPDAATPTLLRARGPLVVGAGGNIFALLIVPAGGALGSQLDADFVYIPSTAAITAQAETMIAAHTPGDYQLAVYGFASTTVRIDATNQQKGWLRAFSA